MLFLREKTLAFSFWAWYNSSRLRGVKAPPGNLNPKGVNKSMKEGIHPSYQQTTITCACGNVIETGSTKKDIKVEVCSKCHPFFTGKQKLVDTGGRVAKFNKKFGLDRK